MTPGFDPTLLNFFRESEAVGHPMLLELKAPRAHIGYLPGWGGAVYKHKGGNTYLCHSFFISSFELEKDTLV